MKKPFRNIVYGFLSWLVPFLTAFLFYNKQGVPTINIFLFKSIMIVTGTLTGVVLLFYYFRKIDKDFLQEGIITGILWFAMNIGLDLVVLVPMSGMRLADYFAQIGLRYLCILIISIGMGAVLAARNTISHS